MPFLLKTTCITNMVVLSAAFCTDTGVRQRRVAHSPRAATLTTSMTTPDDALAFRVRDALLDEEEKPYLIWSESGPKPLKLNLDLLNHRARVLERRRDIDGALAALEWCSVLDPNDGRSWIARARICERSGKKDEAQALLQKGLEWEPKSPYLLQAYGAFQERCGRSDEAIELYTAAVRAKPSHAPAWVACGLLQMKPPQNTGQKVYFPRRRPRPPPSSARRYTVPHCVRAPRALRHAARIGACHSH